MAPLETSWKSGETETKDPRERPQQRRAWPETVWAGTPVVYMPASPSNPISVAAPGAGRRARRAGRADRPHYRRAGRRRHVVPARRRGADGDPPAQPPRPAAMSGRGDRHRPAAGDRRRSARRAAVQARRRGPAGGPGPPQKGRNGSTRTRPSAGADPAGAANPPPPPHDDHPCAPWYAAGTRPPCGASGTSRAKNARPAGSRSQARHAGPSAEARVGRDQRHEAARTRAPGHYARRMAMRRRRGCTSDLWGCPQAALCGSPFPEILEAAAGGRMPPQEVKK